MPTIETNSFRLTFPDSWCTRGAAPRATLAGPKGELLELSSFGIAGSGSSAELAAIKSHLRDNLLSTFAAMTSDGSCEAKTAVQKVESPGSEEFFQQLFQSSDRKVALGLFGMLNRRNALLATLETPASEHMSLLDVAQYLDRIEWLAQDSIKTRPWWKFWR